MFMASRNVDVVLRREPIAKQAQKIFLRVWNSSYSAPVDGGKEFVPPRVR
jgi:hypothetical protein